MKGPLDRTKVVLRHLPPTISQSALMEQIDARFSARYNLFSFRPGKNSLKHQFYSRAYIDFKRSEDVIEFAEFFDGHVFVNEKGTQFKTIVEYAPSQRVSHHWSKKDGRDGTISKDPEYLEFLELIAKPVENLPSAEIQLERREAERAGAAKDPPIVTPLMDFVRQKRAAKVGSRRSLPNGKLARRVGGTPSGSPSSAGTKRSSEKRRGSTTMYVQRDAAKSTSGKEKSTYIQVPKRDDNQLSEKFVSRVTASGNEVLEEENGASGASDIGKKKILLLKGIEKEVSHSVFRGVSITHAEQILAYRVGAGLQMSGGLSEQGTTSVKNGHGTATVRQFPRREASGRIIRSILLNKDTRQGQPFSAVQSEQNTQTSFHDKDKRPPRPQNAPLLSKDANGAPDEKFARNDGHGFYSEKQDRRTRNKDRPDRGVWTPLRLSDGSHASNDSLSSSTSQSAQGLIDSAQAQGEVRNDLNLRSGDLKHVGSSRGHFPVDNGSHKPGGRRGPSHSVKDADGSSYLSEGKPSKRGVASAYSSHEKQVWVQKSSFGS